MHKLSLIMDSYCIRSKIGIVKYVTERDESKYVSEEEEMVDYDNDDE